jgi:presenilin-like A22 family membrane protease
MDLKVPIVLVVTLSLSYSYLDAEMPDPVADEEDEEGEGDETTDEAANDAEASSTSGAETEAAVNGGSTDESVEGGDETDDDTDLELDREALFIGLGDAVIPTVLVASAGFFAPQSVPAVDLFGFPVALPALTAMAGTMVGLVILLRMVLKGRAHAGLPLLNGGTIAGYLVGALAGGLSLVQALGLGPYV